MSLGSIFAFLALTIGTLFFLYAMKYYITLALVLTFSRRASRNGKNGNGNGNGNGSRSGLGKNGSNGSNGRGLLYRLFGKGLNGNHKNGNNHGAGMTPEYEKINLKRQPFISIHLPFYNEKKVANRILTACTSMDYDNYEVVVVDDSTDETIEILEKWKQHPKVKVIHRTKREGFKGGALKVALEHSDPRTEFVVVFDADFIPYPDTLWQFLKYFNLGVNGTNGHNGNNNLENGKYKNSNIAAVQGYQWHVLNKNENWITRGVRIEFAGSYVVERPGTEVVGSMKLIAGSVYMIRADLLRKYGWGTSITEDFQLTLRLYQDGYKVLYTPYIQTPSECVSTIKRLIRQRMRWAEGHTHQIKKMFWKILRSPNLAKREKLEFLYLAPYYLQAAFFLTGTLCWFISDAILRTPLPFWTALWGWCLVLTNMFALPLMNGVGLFLEESPQKDYLGLFSFALLTYILVPFQAYAAVRGLFEKEEGHWFRTPKTGIITDTFLRSRFRRFFEALFPGRRGVAHQSLSSDLAYVTANNQFDGFGIKKRSLNWVTNLVLLSFLTSSLGLGVLASFVPTKIENARAESGFKSVAQIQKEKPIILPEPEKKIIDNIVMVGDSENPNGLQFLFHKEPRVRIKIGLKEIEIATLEAEGLGKARITESYRQGKQFVYPEIFEGVDLVYTVDDNQLTEEFVVKSPQNLTEIVQQIHLFEVEPIIGAGGEYYFVDENKETIFTFPAPYVFEEKNADQRTTEIKYELKKIRDGYELKKVFTTEGLNWLKNPQRQYPVIIDPTVIQTSVTDAESDFGAIGRKLEYSTSTSAWYAFYVDGGTTPLGYPRFERCLASTSCDETGDWTGPTNLDSDADNANISVYRYGLMIYAAWMDDTNTTGDNVEMKTIDTTDDGSPDTLGTLCSGIDEGSIDSTNMVSVATASDGAVYIAMTDTSTDTELKVYKVAVASCNGTPAGGAGFTNITGGGLTAGDVPVLATMGTDLHMVFQDGNLSHSIYSGAAWTTSNTTIAAVTAKRYAITTDGTDIWVLYQNSTTDTNLYLYSGGAWSSITEPFTGVTATLDTEGFSITYDSNEDQLIAYAIYEGTEQAYFKTSPAGAILWSGAYSFSFNGTAGNLDNLSAPMVVSADSQAAVVLDNDDTNFEFAVLPERGLIFLFLVPFIPLFVRRFKCGMK